MTWIQAIVFNPKTGSEKMTQPALKIHNGTFYWDTLYILDFVRYL